MHHPLPFEEIVAYYEKDVFNYSYALIGKQEHAEEITQDVFVRVLRSIHLFRGDSSFKTWLFTITRNVTQDFKRKQFDPRIVLVDDIYPQECSPSAESDYFQFRHESEMCEIVLALPPKFREVILLDVKYDRSMQEIATLLNISVGTVKSRLFRARARMSKLSIWREC